MNTTTTPDGMTIRDYTPDEYTDGTHDAFGAAYATYGIADIDAALSALPDDCAVNIEGDYGHVWCSVTDAREEWDALAPGEPLILHEVARDGAITHGIV